MWITNIIYFWLYSKLLIILTILLKLKLIITSAVDNRKTQLEVEHIFFSIKQLEKGIIYRNKIRYFERLLNRVNDQLFAPSIVLELYHDQFISPTGPHSDYFDTISFSEFLHRKKKVLQHLIKLSQSLIVNYDEELELHFSKYENELEKYLDYEDRYLEFNFPSNLAEDYFFIISNEIRILRSQLTNLFKNRLSHLKRDLRQSFRSIIRFLFKNMDDESDPSNVLMFLTSTTYSDYSILKNAKERNHTKAKYFKKYQIS